MTQLNARLNLRNSLAALGTLAILGLPVAPAWAEGSEPASTPLIAQAASARPEAASAVTTPSFMFPEVNYVQGLGWEIDSGGPAVRIQRFEED